MTKEEPKEVKIARKVIEDAYKYGEPRSDVAQDSYRAEISQAAQIVEEYESNRNL